MTAHATCPYCKHQNAYNVTEQEAYRAMIRYCDMDQGGCDREFAIRFRCEVHTTVIALAEEETK